jgi:hypothetical protein
MSDLTGKMNDDLRRAENATRLLFVAERVPDHV